MVRVLSRWHKDVYRLTRGVIGRRLVDNDMLVLTTTGRQSGRPHQVPLLYLREQERIVVIASYGGRPQYPDWFLNLLAQPEAHVQIRGRHRSVRARVAPEAERSVWWTRAVEAYGGYHDYQARTDRVIPVVFLDPR